AGAREACKAVDAAEKAMREPLPAHKRAEILVKVAAALGRRHDEVARLISDEAGKPMKAARVEAQRAMSTYTFAAVEARKLAGEMVPMDAARAGEGKLAFTLRQPIGVVGAISPFNFPLNLVAHKLAPALAAGADVETAAEKIAANAFSFAGQSCISIQRVYVEHGVYDAFLERFLPRVEGLRVGDPAEEDTDVGPVIDEDARHRILEWIRDSSGEVLTGGELEGDLIRPTVIANPGLDDKV